MTHHSDDSDDDGTRRHGWLRLLGVVGFCLLFFALVARGLAPPTRLLTLVALATVFGGAAAYELHSRGVAAKWLLASLATVAALAGLSYLALQHLDPAPDWRGGLVAATDPMPDTACRSRKIAGDELVMVFGKDGVIGKGNGPFTPVRIGTCPVLSFARGPEGLMVNGFGYDSDGNVVWRIEKNAFSLVLRGFLKGTRPDASTISIVDEKGRENLFIRYQNANAVQVRGTFRCSEMRPVTFGFNSVRVAGEPRATQCVTVAPGTVPGITYTDPAP